LLAALVATDQEQQHSPAGLGVIHAVAGAVVYPQFPYAITFNGLWSPKLPAAIRCTRMATFARAFLSASFASHSWNGSRGRLPSDSREDRTHEFVTHMLQKFRSGEQRSSNHDT
jgi:hypothetical protein